MKITVVVPTFNSGDALYNLFDSLRAQTIGFENIEVIFVDDNSDDVRTLEILGDLESFDNVSVFYLGGNSGFPGHGRNVGLENASGEYIIFSDHDDSYNKDAFKTMYEEIISNDSDMVISNFNQINNGKSSHFKSNIPDKIILNKFNDNLEVFKLPAAIWTRLFKKDFLISNDIKFLEGMLCEDVYVATLATLKANNIVYLPDLYAYNYSIRDSESDKSTIHLRNKKYIEAILNGYLEICKFLNENNVSYGELIFNKHLTSWLYTIVLSEISDKDRLYLFKKAQILFKNFYTEDSYFNGNYNNLVKYILNNEFEKAVTESRQIAKYQKNMNQKENLFKRIKNKIGR